MTIQQCLLSLTAFCMRAAQTSRRSGLRMPQIPSSRPLPCLRRRLAIVVAAFAWASTSPALAEKPAGADGEGSSVILASVDWNRSGQKEQIRFLRQGVGGELVAGADPQPLGFTPGLAATGDFDADGFGDLVIVDLEESRLALISGSREGLRPPTWRDFGAEITGLEAGEINRIDGLQDLVITLKAGSGWTDVLVLEGPTGAWHAEPERHRIAGDVVSTRLAPGAGALRDLHVSTENPVQELVLAGRDRKLSRRAADQASVPEARWTAASASAGPAKSAAKLGVEMFEVNDGGDAGGATCPDTCTLRAAVAGANANPGSTITFSVTTVTPTAAITATEPVTILGGGTVTLDGDSVFGACPLIVEGAATVVDGLIFDGGCLEVQGDGSTITGSYFGMDPSSSVLGSSALVLESHGNTVGGTGASDRNFFGLAALTVRGCADEIFGNYFGVDTAGTSRVGTSGNVNISTSVDCSGLGPTLIGGTAVGAGNLLADTLFINAGAVGTTVQGNFFGTTADGSAPIPGTDATAIEITGDDALIGGTSAAAGNLISGNATAFLFGFGIHVKPGADGTVVQGNTIGTNLAGSADIGAWRYGVFLDLDSDFEAETTVGGAVSGAGNLISGSSEDGIYIFNVTGGPFTGPVVISGNRIGTNSATTAAIPNGANGIRNHRMPNTVIGGTTAAEANIIGGNVDAGIDIDSQFVTGVVVRGNYVGTDATGTVNLGNGDHGVFVDDANDCVIGGTGSGEGNTIAFNGDDGVRVASTLVAQGERNTISGNRIFSNVDLGINLTGGANEGQDPPVLTSALSTPATVSGTLTGSPSTTYDIELFASAACDAGGAGEGERYLGMTTVTTDGAGTVSFTGVIGGTLAAGEVMTATATDPDGNTSEFSDCVTATTNTAVIFTDGFESGDTTAWTD